MRANDTYYVFVFALDTDSMPSQETCAPSDASDGQEAARHAFIIALRRALHHLYDVIELRKNPLCALFSAGGSHDPMALRQILEEGIHALKPASGLSPTSDAWRTYRVLYHRYVEQFDQASVAVNLGLSIRQMRRQEQLALQTLADWLIQRYRLDLVPYFGYATLDEDPACRSKSAVANRDGTAETDAPPDGVAQELTWAAQSSPSQCVNLAEAVTSAIRTVQPIADALNVSLHSDMPDDLPPALAQPVSTRQILLSLLLTAIRSDSQTVRIVGQRGASQIQIEIGPIRRRTEQDAERLAMAEKLAAISGGCLEYRGTDDQTHTACLMLPLAGQIPVLVVDDNADSLRLFERYLVNSPYRFAGIRDPEQVLTLAEQVRPRIIVLDVMLPGVDGWQVLGRLREHPETRYIPVVICTILPQEELATMLGAAGFIRKPVTRDRLLLELDRQMAAAATIPGSSSPHMPATDATTSRQGA